MAVDEIKMNDFSDIKDELANLDTEVADILEKLGELLAANAVIQGDLRITNLGDLEIAQDLVGTEEDDPEVTIQGNLLVTINDTNGLLDSIAAVNAITNKIRIVQETVTATTNTALEFNALTYVAGDYDVSLTVSGSIADSSLRTINGAMTIAAGGAIDYSQLNSVQSVEITAVSTITSVDFSGAQTAPVTTGMGELVLPGATSVKVGLLPLTVTLAAATTFEATYTGAAHPRTQITIGGPDASFSMAATAFTNRILITTTGDVLLPQLTEVGDGGETIIIAGASSSIDLSGLTELPGGATLTAATVNLDALETIGAYGLVLVGPTSVSLPALTDGENTPIVATDATSFYAPEYSIYITPVLQLQTVNLANTGATVTLKNIGDAMTPANMLLDWATIEHLTLTGQTGDLDLSAAAELETLHYSGAAAGTTAPGNQSNTLMIDDQPSSLTTVEFGEDNHLGTLTVASSTLESLETKGVIINTVVSSNSSLETFIFGHSHIDGENATTIAITNNPEITEIDLSSLAKVKSVVITGNADLETIVAPSIDPLAEPVATVTVTISNNDTSGTYDPARAPTETTEYQSASATSTMVSSFKPFIEAYQAQTRSASVTFSIDVDSVDNIETTAVETSTLSSYLTADMAAQAGADTASGTTATDADNQTDGGMIDTTNELALFQ